MAGPGVIFVGADDVGRPHGTPVTDRLLRQLADIKTDGNIVPPPTLSVARHTLKDTPIAVVLVQPSDTPPVRYRGRTWIRVGSRRAIATIQDERILNEKRRYRELSTIPVLTFFNNKGGVGKTSLVYHVSWMLSEIRPTVLVVDLDPQANLTAAFLGETRLERLWDTDAGDRGNTIYQ